MVVRPSMTERDKRDAAVEELLSTEATYVSDMKLLVDVFVLPLEGWAADMQAMRESDSGDGESRRPHLTQQDCRQIFANAKQLATFNRQFLWDLRKAYGGPWRSSAGRHHSYHGPMSRTDKNASSWRGEGGEEGDGGGGSLDDEIEGAVNPGAGYPAGKDQGPPPAAAPALTYPGSSSSGIWVNGAIKDDPFSAVTVRSGGGVSESGRGLETGDIGEGAMVAADDPDQGPRQMLEVFLKSAPFLKMYSVYVNNFDRARECLNNVERENPAVAAFLTACERQRHCRGLRLRDFLILPVQRIPRYRLLLETILRHTPIESSTHCKVEESLNTMGKIASKINSDVTLQQQKNKVYELQQEFGGADFLSASRLFIKEGDLTKVGRNGPERLHFVLFNDMLVYGQAKRMRNVLGSRGSGRVKQLYHHRREVNLHKCFVVDAPSYATKYSSFLGETGLLIVSEEKSFMVMASSAVEKDGWLQAIRACMRDLSLNAEGWEKMRGGQDFIADKLRSPVNSLARSSRWSSSSSAHGSSMTSMVAASAPRSVWVPSKDGGKTSRSMHFSLPPWAGVRKTCGCLSYTELTWGKEGLVVGEGRESLGGAGGVGMSTKTDPGVPPAFTSGGSLPGQDLSVPAGTRVPRELISGDEENTAPKEVSILVSMSSTERLGLRLRDVHPGCGGGVVVVGFEPKSSAKRAGIQQGDRITRVDGVAAFKSTDIAWALAQQYPGGSGGENGRTTHISVTRGFPKTDRPWLPPLELAPVDPMTSPGSSSCVESPGSYESASEYMSAPGRQMFGRDGGAAAHRRGFSVDEGNIHPTATEASSAEAARGAYSARGPGGTGFGALAGGKSGGSAKAPAPAHANVSTGGAPSNPLTAGLPNALAACWTLQTDDPFQMTDDDPSKKREGKPKGTDKGEKSNSKKLKGMAGIAGMGVCVSGSGSFEEKLEFSDDAGNDSEEDSGSSDESLFLAAVSPSRVPPPLVSVASTLPLPPVSMTSSVEGSLTNFSPANNAWYSPTASQAETVDTSMSWLKPLPPPPPKRDEFGTPPAPTHSPPVPGRVGPSQVYSGQWAQTPPRLGEPKISPSGDLMVDVS